jgi:hypothetical protein
MIRLLDKISLLGMALGTGLILLPGWAPAFEVGFFVTALSTLLQIVTSHLVA